MAGVVALFVALALLAAFVRGDLWLVAVPGLVTGLGTALLAIVTVWLAQADRAQLAAERQQRERELAEASARQVIAYATFESDPSKPLGLGLPAIIVRNTSGETILDVELHSAIVPADNAPQPRGEWQPGPQERYRTFVEPRDQVLLRGSWAWTHGADSETRPYLSDVVAVFEWTDNRGQRWRRDGKTAPTRIAA